MTTCPHSGLAVGVAPLPALASFVPAASLAAAVFAGWIARPAMMLIGAAGAIGFSVLLCPTVTPLVPRRLIVASAVRCARSRASGGR